VQRALTEAELSRLAGRFKLLGEPMRLKILQSLCHDPHPVKDILKAIGSTPVNVSKHLARLGGSGNSGTRQGRPKRLLQHPIQAGDPVV